MTLASLFRPVIFHWRQADKRRTPTRYIIATARENQSAASRKAKVERELKQYIALNSTTERR